MSSAPNRNSLQAEMSDIKTEGVESCIFPSETHESRKRSESYRTMAASAVTILPAALVTKASVHGPEIHAPTNVLKQGGESVPSFTPDDRELPTGKYGKPEMASPTVEHERLGSLGLNNPAGFASGFPAGGDNQYKGPSNGKTIGRHLVSCTWGEQLTRPQRVPGSHLGTPSSRKNHSRGCISSNALLVAALHLPRKPEF